jgi:hypothetical protein
MPVSVTIYGTLFTLVAVEAVDEHPGYIAKDGFRTGTVDSISRGLCCSACWNDNPWTNFGHWEKKNREWERENGKWKWVEKDEKCHCFYYTSKGLLINDIMFQF